MFSRRIHNFCAGPAAIPEAVLVRAQKELLNWQNTGTSVMEISHRSKDFMIIAERAEHNLRKLMNISDDYAVLFLQGGASLQFSTLVMNLLQNKADYLQTGNWSKKALVEARRYESAGFGKINLVANAESLDNLSIPDVSTWQLSKDADYFHYCPNETIGGLTLHDVPNVDAPIVADMSSNILSAPLDVSRFGMIYAGAQKNIGPAGLTLVIIRKDLLGRAHTACPATQNYKNQFDNDSMLNTPPTFAWYLSGLVFEWLIEQGGVSAIYEKNLQKAQKLYDFIDNCAFYQNKVDKKYRSIMNIPFTLEDSNLDALFLQESAKAGLANLKGHKLVGGMRASIYNATPIAAIDALTEFMQAFAQKHG